MLNFSSTCSRSFLFGQLIVQLFSFLGPFVDSFDDLLGAIENFGQSRLSGRLGNLELASASSTRVR